MTVASRVGFIGLGNMGLHMARNLMKNGNRLVVCDIDPKRLAEIKAEGAEVVAHPADVASATQTIVTMLPSSPHVRAVYNSDFGILKNIRPDSLCMDSSTIDQQASIEISRLMAEKKAHYVDAPVSGGVVGAQQGTLTFMVGADSTATFDRARVFLVQMGKNVVNCGKVGNGQAAKICNNMLLGIEMIGVAETMNLGIRMGLDAKQLAAIINTSSGRCWNSDTYNPVPGVIDGIPSSRNYEGGFASALMAKDLSLAQNASTLLGVPTPLGSLAHQLYRILSHSKDYQGRDFGVVYEFLKDDRPADGEGGSKK